MKKYILFFSLACSCLFANTLSQIKESKEVKIALSTKNPPFSSLKDGNYVGFEADLAKKLGAYLVGKDGKVTIVPLPNASYKIKYLQDNTVDIVLANFLKTEKTAKQVDFAIPYFSVSIAGLTKTSSGINELKDLSKKRVAIKENTAAIEVCAKKCKDSQIIEVADNKEALGLLKDGKIDAYVNTNLVVMAYPITDKDLMIAPKKIGSSMFLSPGVQKGNKELIKAINAAMFEFAKQGYFEDIYNNTFGNFYEKSGVTSKDFLLEDLYDSF